MRGVALLTGLIASIASSALATEQDAGPKGLVQAGWRTYRFHIKWGIQTRTKQVWDGHAKIDQGRMISITPFIRHEILYDSMMVSATSWRSTTYADAEGIYLSVCAPSEATVFVHTETHDFRFRVGSLEDGETRRELDGDIEITNATSEVLYRIAGLEKGGSGQGTAAVTPTVAQANTLGSWTITYASPEGGLPVGGGIRISWHFTRTWGEPQFTDPGGKNYVTVRTTGKSRLEHAAEHCGLLEYPFTRGRILVRIFDEPLPEGEQIIVVLGDTSHGSPGFEAPVVAEEQAVIRVEDCTEVIDGVFPVYRRLKALPVITVRPMTEPKCFFVVAPSVVRAGSSFGAQMVVEDAFRNVVPTFEGHLEVLVDGRVTTTVVMKPEHQGRLDISGLKLAAPGPHWITVRQVDDALVGESNPIKCVAEAPASLVVWGELHGHTQYSDGYGSADDYFRFARQRALLDCAAITDHDVELDAPDYHVVDMWREINAAVSRHHDPRRFCSVPAYEWSPARVTISTIEAFGDHNVYYGRAGMPVFKAEDCGTNTLPGLYGCLEAVENTAVQVISHVGGAIGNWDHHHPLLESVAEIYSVHGSFEAFGEIALQKRYTVGFVAAADSHSGQIGGFPPGSAEGHYTHGGLTAAFVSENSRQAWLRAIKRRQVYATSGPRILVDFRVNGQQMGSVIETRTTPVIEAEVIGAAPLVFVEVVKNGRVIHVWENEYRRDDQLTFLWGNRVEQSDLLDFDRSLWSYELRHVEWDGAVEALSRTLALGSTCSFDYPKDSIMAAKQGRVSWKSQTRGDWDGLTLCVPEKDMRLRLKLGEYERIIDLSDLPRGASHRSLGDLDRLVVVNGTPLHRQAVLRIKDRTVLQGWNYYYLRALQVDGETAWSSPIWISTDAR